MTKPAVTSWYGKSSKSSIIYKVCYIPGGWDRDFWTINSTCLRSSIDLTILILTSYRPWSWIQPRSHWRIQILFFCWVLLWLRTQISALFCINKKDQESTSFQSINVYTCLFKSNSTESFFVSLAIFYKLFAYIIYHSPLFFLANFSTHKLSHIVPVVCRFRTTIVVFIRANITWVLLKKWLLIVLTQAFAPWLWKYLGFILGNPYKPLFDTVTGYRSKRYRFFDDRW